MTQLTTKRAKELLDILEDTKETMFKDRKTDYPYTEWEHKRTQIKQRLTKLPQYIHQAVQTIVVVEEQKCGPKPKLDLEKKVNLFLTIRLLNKSNRTTEELLSYFHRLIGEEINYKYIKRLYNDPEIRLVLHNVFVLLLKDESALSGELAGDGTGYAISVENHYRTGPRSTAKSLFTFLR